MIKDPFEPGYFAVGGPVGFRRKPFNFEAPPVDDTTIPPGAELIGQEPGAPPQSPVAMPSDDGGDDYESMGPVQAGYSESPTGWGRAKGSATSDWRTGSASLDRNTGGSFIGDWTDGALGRQTTGQGINSQWQDLGWGMKSYGDFANIDTPIGPIGLLPGQGLAKAAGNALLDYQIDAIDSSFDALDDGNMDYAVPGADLEGDDTVTVSDAQGNTRTFGSRQYDAIADLQKNDWEAANVGRRATATGTANFNVTPENQIAGANSTWESDSYGDRNEAEAVASSGWGSDAHFDAIDAQFDDMDDGGGDSGGGK